MPWLCHSINTAANKSCTHGRRILRDILCRKANVGLLNLLRRKTVNIFWGQTCRRRVTGHWEISYHTIHCPRGMLSPIRGANFIIAVAPVTGFVKINNIGKGGAVPALTTHCGGAPAPTKHPICHPSRSNG